MIITLKDGSSKEYQNEMAIIDIAADISEGLARMACAAELNGKKYIALENLQDPGNIGTIIRTAQK